MSRFINNESALFNGISQQSPELRLDSQVTDATNTRLTVANGVEKRPSAKLMNLRDGQYGIGSLVHKIDRGIGERYLMVFPDNVDSTLDEIVYDVTANTRLKIIYESLQVEQYIKAEDDGNFIPSEHLALTTVLDTTIATNKNVICAMDDTTGIPNIGVGNEVYVWFRDGIEQVERTISFDVHVWNGVKEATNDTELLVDSFLITIGLAGGYTGTKISDSVVHITRDNGADFVVTATDTFADTTMTVAPVAGTQIDNLPPKAFNDQIIKIVTDSAQDSDYYLIFDSSTNSYFEHPAPDVPVTIDASTMPHQILRLIDDTGAITGNIGEKYFFVEKIVYSDRVTGDLDSSPNPSFIGKKVADSFFFKNRFGLLTGENVIMSVIDNLFNFFPSTIKAVLSDDPIDVSVSTNRAVRLLYIEPFPDALILIGDIEQFALTSEGRAFTSENVTINPTTSYSVNKIAPPESIGASMYFNAPLDNYSTLREYQVLPDTLITDAVDVGGHVPRYVPLGIKQIIAESNLEYIFQVDSSDYDKDGDNFLWVYKFFLQGNEKIQSAWMQWKFWFQIIGGATFDGKLFLIGTEFTDEQTNTILVGFNLDPQPDVYLRLDTLRPFKNTEPLIDRLKLYEDDELVHNNEGCIVSIEVDETQYDLVEVDSVELMMVDRYTGLYGDYRYRQIIDGKFYLFFDLCVADDNIDTTFDYINNFMIGQYKIGGTF